MSGSALEIDVNEVSDSINKSPTVRNELFTYEGPESFKALKIGPNEQNMYTVFDFHSCTHVQVDDDRNVLNTKDWGQPLVEGKQYMACKPKY